MKKILLFLLLFPALSWAQTKSISYTKLTVNATGHASASTAYNPGVDATVDSVWTAIQTTHTIGSDDVWQATKMGTGGILASYKRGQSVLWPYQVASAFSGGSVSSGNAVVPSAGLGTVAATVGGTGLVSPPTWNIPIYKGVSAWDSVGVGTAAQILTSGGAAAKPAWITSVPVANGGTGSTTFSGAQTNLGWTTVRMTADSTTTGQALVGTPLQFTIGTTDVWDFDIYLQVGNNGTNGTKIGILLPASATLQAMASGNTSGITAYTSDIITASTTSGANFNTSAISTAIIVIHGTVAGGGTGGAVVLQFLATTSGTATVKAKSYIKAHRIS